MKYLLAVCGLLCLGVVYGAEDENKDKAAPPPPAALPPPGEGGPPMQVSPLRPPILPPPQPMRPLSLYDLREALDDLRDDVKDYLRPITRPSNNVCRRFTWGWYQTTVNLPSQMMNRVRTYYLSCKIWRPTGSKCQGGCPSYDSMTILNDRYTTSTPWYSWKNKCTCCRGTQAKIVRPWAYCRYVVTLGCRPQILANQFVSPTQHAHLANNYRYYLVDGCKCNDCQKRDQKDEMAYPDGGPTRRKRDVETDDAKMWIDGASYTDETTVMELEMDKEYRHVRSMRPEHIEPGDRRRVDILSHIPEADLRASCPQLPPVIPPPEIPIPGGDNSANNAVDDANDPADGS